MMILFENIFLGDPPSGGADLGARQIVLDVRILGQQLGEHVVKGRSGIDREAQTNATRLLMCLLRSQLASKRVLDEYGLSKQGWMWLLQQIEQDFQGALVLPGESVGTVAAQSIGEPTTQMCLNT